ncbi:MAG: hypothetical protein V4719_26010, partial [Planctomycetota bacterium]
GTAIRSSGLAAVGLAVAWNRRSTFGSQSPYQSLLADTWPLIIKWLVKIRKRDGTKTTLGVNVECPLRNPQKPHVLRPSRLSDSLSDTGRWSPFDRK